MQRVLAVAAISIPLLSLWYYRERSTRNQVEDESVEIVPETVVEETVPAILEENDDQEEDDETATTILVQYSTGRMTVEVMDESRQYFSLQLLQNPYVKSAAALKYRLYCFFKTLNVVPSECNVLATYTTPFGRDEFARVAFDCFKVPKLCLMSEAQLTLKSTGRDTGIVVDIGSQQIVITPIYNGRVCEETIKCISFGTDDIVHHGARLLMLNKCTKYKSLSYAAQLCVMKEILNDFAYVLPNPTRPSQRRAPRMYPVEMYDQNFREIVDMRLDIELFLPPGLLFTDKRCELHRRLLDTIDKCHPDIQDDLRNNIVLTGELRTLPGLRVRFDTLLYYAQPHVDFHLISTSQPDCIMMGGRIQSSEMTSRQWVTKEEYDLNGLPVVQSRCYLDHHSCMSA